MEVISRLEAALSSFVLDPKNHELLTLVKGIRNGIVYGCKVRFPHALVIVFIFQSGSLRKKLGLILNVTMEHARRLALFTAVFKTTLIILAHGAPTEKRRSVDAFIAGLVAGYYIIGRSRSAVAQQMVIYTFARSVMGLAKLAIKERVPTVPGPNGVVPRGGLELLGNGRLKQIVENNAWAAFSSLSWAAALWLWSHHPETLQSSMRNSMTYIYGDSDHWDSLRTLIWHNK